MLSNQKRWKRSDKIAAEKRYSFPKIYRVEQS